MESRFGSVSRGGPGRARGKPPDLERRPSDEALLTALKLNDDHIRGLTRLDQQLVYVPLALLTGALYAFASNTTTAMRPSISGTVFLCAAIIVAVLVGLGMVRNERRHQDLLDYRAALLTLLEVPQPGRRDWLWLGRLA